MSGSTYDYKTVALPQTVQGKRKRGVSEADLVAATLGELIHLEAVDGWEYMRSDILAAGSRGGMFSKESKVTSYSVLVFRRVQEGVWPMGHEESVSVVPAPASAAVPTPAPAPAAAPAPRKPAPAPVSAPPPPPSASAAPAPAPRTAAPLIGDPTSPLATGGLLTSGGQFRADSSGSVATSPRPAPRPPLGSAQD